jgi:inner membrane protein
MDSLTHIVLGACIGDAIASKKLGKKAMIIGALAQSTPDIDFITTFWLTDTQDILAHRGITHSIIFSIVATFGLALIGRFIFRKSALSFRHWLMIFGINLFTHILIDSFNAYGIGWFEPFSSHRVALHILFVADPLFSIWPFIAFIALIITRTSNPRRAAWRLFGISFSFLYLCFAIIGKTLVNNAVNRNLTAQGIEPKNYFTTPTPFNSLLWFVVAKHGDGYHVGYRSIFDSRREMDFTYFPQNDFLLDSVVNRKEVDDMRTFANEFYTVEERNDTTIFNVLRFGQVVGWYNPKEKFAFYFYMDKPGSNELMAQRGRFEKWNARTIGAFFRRMKGN